MSIHHLVAKNTIDEQIMNALEKKKLGQNELIKAVKAELDAGRVE